LFSLENVKYLQHQCGFQNKNEKPTIQIFKIFFFVLMKMGK
jgi:hypothetical protein